MWRSASCAPAGRSTRTRSASAPGGLAFTGDGRVLVTSECCAGGAAVSGWDARSGALRFRRAVTEHNPAFAISPRDGTLAVGTEDGRVLWWDARTGRSLRPPTKVAVVGGLPARVLARRAAARRVLRQRRALGRRHAQARRQRLPRGDRAGSRASPSSPTAGCSSSSSPRRSSGRRTDRPCNASPAGSPAATSRPRSGGTCSRTGRTVTSAPAERPTPPRGGLRRPIVMCRSRYAGLDAAQRADDVDLKDLGALVDVGAERLPAVC